MAGKFNFTTKLGLDSAGFKQGVNKVRASLGSLKSSFLSLAGALGAGLGFTQLISKMKETATELSVAQNTLKNVSYQTKKLKGDTSDVTYEISNYAENLAFVRKLSSDYAQDLVAVTDNYAKFTAACKKTDLALEDQRDIFESLTKAAAYYHLSADRTKDMMNAVTQMMSKGKVTAEELRRQLGNTLPGAFNMMAAAMKVSTSELDRMMRNGEVVASEVLPKFAAMLDTVTATAEFDSLQMSMNKLKNAWYDLVERSGSEKLFKGIIDGSTKALNATTQNMTMIKSAMVGLVSYFASVKLFSFFIKQGDEWEKSLEKNLQVAQRQMGLYGRAIRELAAKNQIAQTANKVASPLQGITLDPDAINQMQKYNAAILAAAQANLKLGKITKAEFDIIQKEINEATAALGGMTTAVNTNTVATKRLKTAWQGVGVTLSKAGAAIKNFFQANWVFMLISALVSAWNYLKKIKQEADDIAAISDNYKTDIDVIAKGRDAEIEKLKNSLKIVLNINNAESERLIHLRKINKALGLVGEKAFKLDELDKVAGKYEEIANAVNDWAEATKTQSLIQGHANTIADASAKKIVAQKRKEALYEKLKQRGALNNDKWMGIAVWDLRRQYENATIELEAYDAVMKESEKSMEDLGVKLGDFYNVLDDGGDDKFANLTEVMNKYNEDVKKLKNQLKEGAITLEEYNTEFDTIVKNAFKAATATGELSLDDVLSKMDKGSTLSALEKWYYNLSKDAAEAVQKALINGISEEIMKNIDKEIEEAADALEKQTQKELEKEQKSFEFDAKVMAGEYKVKPVKNRNALFDYSKSAGDVLGEEFGLSDDWLQAVSSAYKKAIEDSKGLTEKTERAQKELDELSAKFQYASNEAATLEAAMNYQKVVEDIKNLRKELGNIVYTGVKDLATSVDRVVSAADTLKKTMNDVDSTGWDKFMAVFNLITQIADSALGIYETINQAQELNLQLESAKIAEQTALNALLKEENALRWEAFAALQATEGVTNAEIAKRFEGLQALFQEQGIMGALNGLKKQEAAQTVKNTALKGAEAAASTAAASASAGEAVAGATASGAKMPFPYNLIAIAGGIAAVVSALSMMSKFEKGGIVGGSSTRGDHNVVRINSGEMVLNKAQQGTLYRAIASGNLGGGGGGEWRVRGTDLIKVINNTQNKLRG